MQCKYTAKCLNGIVFISKKLLANIFPVFKSDEGRNEN